MTFFTLYLASLGDTMTKLMTYVPFSFMRAVFTSGQEFFNLREAFVCLDFGFAPFYANYLRKASLCVMLIKSEFDLAFSL